jgi:K(+)-stimulated pyrophosphate-energized sodium pump
MTYGDDANTAVRVLIALVAAASIAAAVYISKRRPVAIGEEQMARTV